ncbi:helix-turn-helix transcriptional regulator [Mycolicibacterium sp.]|uniref:helix-turn-helix transcriptional regulator n=1 Tax=Mycolicibacterium sp. TaxID=2320850 RepID=UPI003D11C5E1
MRDGPETRLADFLKAARSRLSPERAGIVDAGRRRVAGLRREELALLAGVSVDYYTRLEQGRSKSASPEVLLAIAEALQLDDAERKHLNAIAKPAPSRRRPAKPQRLHQATRALLRTLDAAGKPAFVLGRRLDILGHNRLAGLLITDFASLPPQDRNQARFVFLDPHARELYADWDEVAADSAAMLRMDAGQHPHDPALSALVGELSIHSPEFRKLWARNRVQQRTTGTKRYHHPLVGDITVSYQALSPADDPEQQLFVYDTEPNSPSAHALQLLAGSAASEPTDAAAVAAVQEERRRTS